MILLDRDPPLFTENGLSLTPNNATANSVIVIALFLPATDQLVFIFLTLHVHKTMAVIHPASQRLSDGFHTRGNPKVIICICFLLPSLGLPCRGLSARLCDRPHVLSRSQGRCVAGREPKSTVRCTDKENRLATMHHRDADICESLRGLCGVEIQQNFVQSRRSVITNAADTHYHTNMYCQFPQTVY